MMLGTRLRVLACLREHTLPPRGARLGFRRLVVLGAGLRGMVRGLMLGSVGGLVLVARLRTMVRRRKVAGERARLREQSLPPGRTRLSVSMMLRRLMLGAMGGRSVVGGLMVRTVRRLMVLGAMG